MTTHVLTLALVMSASILVSCSNEPISPQKQNVPIDLRIEASNIVQFDTAFVLPSGTFIRGILDTNNDVLFRRLLRDLVGDSIDPYLVRLFCRGTINGNLVLSVDNIDAFTVDDINVRESISRMRTYLRVPGSDSFAEIKELDTETEGLMCEYWSFVADSIAHVGSTDPHYIVTVYSWKKSRELFEMRSSYHARRWGRGDSFMLKAERYVARQRKAH